MKIFSILLILYLITVLVNADPCSDICTEPDTTCNLNQESQCLLANGGECFWCGTEVLVGGITYQCDIKYTFPCWYMRQQTNKTGSCAAAFVCYDGNYTAPSTTTSTTSTTTTGNSNANTLTILASLLIGLLTLLLFM